MASSSLTIDDSEHDVFLSFRGEDTRNNFTSHLYEDLIRSNIKAFIDRMLDKGEVLTPALHRAIERAKISLVIFSADYASSSFCLDELVKILDCKRSIGQIVMPIFYKVDPSHLRKLKGTFEEAFAKHDRCRQETSEQEMKVFRWKEALEEAANLTGWHVTNTCIEAEEIQKITLDVSMKLKWASYSSKFKGKERMSIPLVGESTVVANLEKIWECLMDHKISRVGVYGMGGVGKTTILTHINNRLVGDVNSFQDVYWVTVSKESSIYQLQSKIAEVIELDLSREGDESVRAIELRDALNKMKKSVLILDDMWKSFELEEVGIPTFADGRKLLLTTREQGVCKRMKCERIVKIEPLLEKEAKDLFIKECGHQIDDNPELKATVEVVVKECGGLPLAIVAIARSTRGFAETYEWRNILNELQKPSDRQNLDMEEKVFKLLKVSYDRLRNDKYRQGLHYCAMHPEDDFIKINSLIRYWIGGGLINELDSRQEELDMGNTIVNELIDASLLEHHGSYHVKMHDVVRDMVLSITRGKIMVKAGLQLQDFPKFTDWSANLEVISIMDNNLERCSFNRAPNCNKLRILLMQNNYDLSEFPNCFFDHMQSLTILDMGSLFHLKLLPDSISKMEALRMLILDRCYSLEYIPSLSALKELRHLNLSRCKSLKKLPEGMEEWVNLKLLRVNDAKALCGLIPSDVLKKVSLLEELSLEGTNVEVEAGGVIGLKKLEILRVDFKSFGALNLYLESRHWERLESYFISNNYENFPEKYLNFFYGENDDYDRTIYLCKDKDWECEATKAGSSDFVFPFNVEKLYLMNWDSPMDGAKINQVCAQLRGLTLKKCEIKYVISIAFTKELLENLEYLEVGECAYMEEIIGTEEYLNQSNHKNYPTIQLPKLRYLALTDLPRLRSIYRGNMELPCLETLKIHQCNKLGRLPLFRELPNDILGSNLWSELWWDSLLWDDHNHKQIFQKFFSKQESETGCLDLTL